MKGKGRRIMLTPIGWVAIILFVIGFSTFIAMNIFVEFTGKARVRFVAGVVVWGVVCITLTVWSFLSSFK